MERVPPFVGSTQYSRAAAAGIFERGEPGRVQQIIEAWARVGRTVKVWLDVDGYVRSNLVNGLPPSPTYQGH